MKTKIVHLVCSFPPYQGGMGNSTYEIVRNMNLENGAEVCVITPMYNKNIDQVNSGVNTVWVKPFFSIGNAAFLPQLVLELRKYDIIHLHYPFYGAEEFVLLAKILYGNKFRLFIHYHMDATAKGLKGLIFRVYQKICLPLILKKSEKVSCASKSYIEKSLIKKYFNKNKEKFYEIPFGVSSDKFKVKLNKKEPKRQIKKVLFVGGLDRAHYFKGLDVLIEVFSKLNNANARLLIVGDGDLRDNYEKKVCSKGLSKKVEFLGKIDNNKLPEIYSECDVFILPSINRCEAFGLVLLEAMASGLPVIASRLPGVDSVFMDGVEGHYVEPNNVQDLKYTIEKILNNDTLAKKMGENGRMLVEKKYSWEKVSKKFIELY